MNNLKVIFHIDQLDRWELTIKNTHNFRDAVQNGDIIILANAEAVKACTREGEFERELREILDLGVKILVCKNALNMFSIDEDRLIKLIETVPAGVVELVKRQNEGYRYIKP